MPSNPSLSPIGLPSSPRANRKMQMLAPLDTSFSSHGGLQTPSPSYYASSSSAASDNKQSPHRNRDSLIFANATIPLSPASSTSSSSLRKDNSPYDTTGLTPRKRSAFARLFCCFGREERARRRVAWATGFEKVGEPCHWSEY